MKVSLREPSAKLHDERRSGGRFTSLKGALLPLTFMEAPGSHRSTWIDTESIRRMAHGKLAEITVRAGRDRATSRLSNSLVENNSDAGPICVAGQSVKLTFQPTLEEQHL